MTEQIIRVRHLEYFDKTYGNSYFSAVVTFDGKDYQLEPQYGYGSQFEFMAVEKLTEAGVIPSDKDGRRLSFHKLRELGIVLDCQTTKVKKMKDL